MKQYLLNEDSEPRHTYCYGFDVKVYDRSKKIRVDADGYQHRQTRLDRYRTYDSSFWNEVAEFARDAIVKILLDIKASHPEFVRSVQFSIIADNDKREYLVAQCSLFVTKTLTEQEVKDLFIASFNKIGSPELTEVEEVDEDELSFYDDDQESIVSYFDIDIDKNIMNVELVEDIPPEEDFPELDEDEIDHT